MGMCKLLALSRQIPAYVGSASRFADACELISRQLSQYPDASSASEPKNDLWRCVETVDCLMTTTTWPSGKLLYESRPNRLIAYRGTRIGEARPTKSDPATFQISVVNPTSVYDKAKLITDTGNLVLMSETSATEKIQSIERNKFRSCGHHVLTFGFLSCMACHKAQTDPIVMESRPPITCWRCVISECN